MWLWWVISFTHLHVTIDIPNFLTFTILISNRAYIWLGNRPTSCWWGGLGTRLRTESPLPSVFKHVVMEPVTLYGGRLSRKYNRKCNRKCNKMCRGSVIYCDYGTVIIFLCRYLIPHNFKSRHYDPSGREVITKVGVPHLIYICNPLGEYHLGNRPSLLKLIIQYYQGQERLLHAYCPCLHVS